MNIRFKKEDIILILVATLMVLLTIVIFSYSMFITEYKNKQSVITTKKQVNINNAEVQQEDNGVEQEATTTEWKCLGEDEIAEYPIKKGTLKRFHIHEHPLTIFVKNKNTDEEIFNFQIDNVKENYRSAEVCKCGVYVVRVFNYDSNKTKQAQGFKEELWIYDYSGNRESIILLSEKPDEFISYYNSGFRIPKTEHYIALIKSYYGKKDYSLVIKDLNTREDVFVLSHNELMKQYPKIKGMFDFREWTKDGRYFYGALSDAAIEKGFFRIDTETWEYEVFEVPEFIGGGDQLNIETGWITYHTDMVWTGIYDITEAIKQERREQGIGTTLYIYNLFTKEKRFIYKTDEPLWFTKPEWISDTEVEYELPNDEKKIYQLN